jgi:hypothetical protein
MLRCNVRNISGCAVGLATISREFVRIWDYLKDERSVAGDRGTAGVVT